MNCDICHRFHHPKKLPFLCAVDARNRLYEGRVAQATALLANETLEQRINDILSRSTASSRPDGPTRAVRIDAIKSEETQAADRTSQIIAQADKLRAEVEAAKADIEERKKKVARRKADIAEASSGINARRTRLLEETKRSIQMTRYRWNQCFENTTATRGFLCMEAARVYGLRRIKRSNKYELGGVEMVDLPGMIHASPELITNSLAHIAHILMLASHYLAIRLPAEITLPHSDYPRPTIFTLSHSYRHGEVIFPGAVALPPTTQSGHSTKHVSRPRPLFIDKPLSVLAKEDPSTYSLFIEGVILLAYDIAWACCTQGVPIGDKSSYEDVYNMGRNLYNLLIGNQLINSPALRLAQTPDETEPPEMFPNQLGGNMMGRWSHGTTHTFLGSAEGNEFLKGFQLPSPVKLADRLKKKMLSDADGLDWEMLEDEAWAPDEPMEEGVQGKHNRAGRSEQRLFGVESVLSTVTAKTMADSTKWEASRLDLDQPPSPGTAKNSGTSGWTKIKSR